MGQMSSSQSRPGREAGDEKEHKEIIVSGCEVNARALGDLHRHLELLRPLLGDDEKVKLWTQLDAIDSYANGKTSAFTSAGEVFRSARHYVCSVYHRLFCDEKGRGRDVNTLRDAAREFVAATGKMQMTITRNIPYTLPGRVILKNSRSDDYVELGFSLCERIDAILETSRTKDARTVLTESKKEVRSVVVNGARTPQRTAELVFDEAVFLVNFHELSDALHGVVDEMLPSAPDIEIEGNVSTTSTESTNSTETP